MKNPFLVLFLGILIVISTYVVFLFSIPHPIKPPYIPPAQAPTPVTYTEVDLVNHRVHGITSLYCKDVDVTLEQTLTFHLKGWICYEKPTRFRLSCGIRDRAECDIGSNDRDFWFWSRRMKPSGLFWCDHAHTLSTRLRTPLNPLWMMECLGLNSVKTEGIRSMQTPTGTDIYETRQGTMGVQVTKVTMLNTNQHLIVGHALVAQNGAVIASSKILEWQQVDGITVPRTVEMVWHEENVKITFRLNSPTVNVAIPPQAWEIPGMQPKIYMPNY